MILTDQKIARLMKRLAKYPNQLTKKEQQILVYIRLQQEQIAIKKEKEIKK